MNTYETIANLLNSMGCPVKAGYIGPMGTGMLTFAGQESAKKAFVALSNAFKVRPPREHIIPTGKVINGGRSLMMSEWKVGIYGAKS